jgi:hypothetical protein
MIRPSLHSGFFARSGLERSQAAARAATSTAEVISIQFQAPKDTVFDFAIDDIGFY